MPRSKLKHSTHGDVKQICLVSDSFIKIVVGFPPSVLKCIIFSRVLEWVFLRTVWNY